MTETKEMVIYRSVAEEEVQLSEWVHFVQIETIVAHGAHRIRHGHRLLSIQKKNKKNKKQQKTKKNSN